MILIQCTHATMILLLLFTIAINQSKTICKTCAFNIPPLTRQTRKVSSPPIHSPSSSLLQSPYKKRRRSSVLLYYQYSNGKQRYSPNNNSNSEKGYIFYQSTTSKNGCPKISSGSHVDTSFEYNQLPSFEDGEQLGDISTMTEDDTEQDNHLLRGENKLVKNEEENIATGVTINQEQSEKEEISQNNKAEHLISKTQEQSTSKDVSMIKELKENDTYKEEEKSSYTKSGGKTKNIAAKKQPTKVQSEENFITMKENQKAAKQQLVHASSQNKDKVVITLKIQNPQKTEKSKQKHQYYYTPAQLSTIKSQISILDVLSSYNLPQYTQTSVNRAKCICPFHNDHNPSLHIDGTKGIYKCFACGAGGDMFHFVREYTALENGGKGQKMSFGESVFRVVQDYGNGTIHPSNHTYIPSSGEYSGYTPSQKRYKQQRIAQVNAEAGKFYATKLLHVLDNANSGKARTYLRCNRLLSPKSVMQFGIGYAPDVYFGDNGGWSGKFRKWGEGSLVEHLKEKGFSVNEIVESGLATRTKQKNKKQQEKMRRNDKRREITNENVNNSNDKFEDEDSKNEDDEEENDYSTIMDRFRNRVMVPIMDVKDDSTIIAFGGRILEDPEEKKAEDENQQSNKTKLFQHAKYINSPDSVLFSKKNTLFNLHSAETYIEEHELKKEKEEAARQQQQENGVYNPTVMPSSSKSSSKRGSSIIIVEGYFDAISLANAGIEEVTASMGAALSLEQLELAAEAVDTIHGGSIILCLDSDEAGLNAMERLCSGNILSKLVETHVVDVCIATLPNGYKDPAEFIEARSNNGRTSISAAGDALWTEVFDNTKPWTDWYLDRLVSSYNVTDDLNNETSTTNGGSGSRGSFSDICDRISTFLATAFRNSADRTSLAYDVADKLAEVVLARRSMDQGAIETGSNIGTTSSNRHALLRIQLESDLLDMASRKADARQNLERRIELAEAFEFGDDDKASSKIFTSDSNMKTAAYKKYPQLKAANENTEKDSLQSTIREKRGRNRESIKNKGNSGTNKNNRHYSRSKRNQAPPPFTPHFNGINFAYKNDAEWLGISSSAQSQKTKENLVLGLKTSVNSNDIYSTERFTYNRGKPKNVDLVYFNSNTFWGNKFLTQEAMNAGYGMDRIASSNVKGLSVQGVATSSLLQQDADKVLLAAEDRLLRTMLKFAPARSAMKIGLATSIESGVGTGPALIEWSSPDREWLFKCLADSLQGCDPLPRELQDGGTISQLRQHLSCRPDAPAGAFGNITLQRDGNKNSFDQMEAMTEDSASILDAVTEKSTAAGFAASSDSLNAQNQAGKNVTTTPISSVERNSEQDINHISSNVDDIESWAASIALSTITDEEDSLANPEQDLIEKEAIPNVEADVMVSNDSEHPSNVEQSYGTLDMFFMPEDDDSFLESTDDDATREMRAELTIQETLAIILRATALKRMFSLKEQWRACASVLSKRRDGPKSKEPIQENDSEFGAYYSKVGFGPSQYDEMEVDELESLCSELASQVSEATKAAHDLDSSAKRVGSRVLDYSSPQSIGSRNSIAQQERLAKTMDEFMASLPEDKQRPESPGSEDYVFGSDQFDPDIDARFGGGGPKIGVETDNNYIDGDGDLSDINAPVYESYLPGMEDEYSEEETTDWETFESIVNEEENDTHFALPQIEPFSFFDDDTEFSPKQHEDLPQDAFVEPIHNSKKGTEDTDEISLPNHETRGLSQNETSLDFNSVFE